MTTVAFGKKRIKVLDAALRALKRGVVPADPAVRSELRTALAEYLRWEVDAVKTHREFTRRLRQEPRTETRPAVGLDVDDLVEALTRRG